MRAVMKLGLMTMLVAPVLTMAQGRGGTAVLAEMQKAIGGADKVAAVRTFTATGTTTRVAANGTTEIPVELSLELPDKYMTRTVAGGQGSMAIYRNMGFNGDGLINVVDAPPDLNQALRARTAVDRPAAAGQTAEATAAVVARQLLTARKDFARLMLGMFGASAAVFPLEFSHAGLAEAADGQADIVEAKGADGFEVRLFVDTKTHLPLMMTWADPGAGANAGRMIERRIYYSDFKKTGGVSLPHTQKRSVDGKPTEETTFAEIKINPKIDAKTFAVSK